MMARCALVLVRDEQPLRSPQPTVYHIEMRPMTPVANAIEARLMSSRAEIIGKLAVVVHELGKVVLVATIFLALYQRGLLAYLCT